MGTPDKFQFTESPANGLGSTGSHCSKGVKVRAGNHFRDQSGTDEKTRKVH